MAKCITLNNKTGPLFSDSILNAKTCFSFLKRQQIVTNSVTWPLKVISFFDLFKVRQLSF